MISCHHCLRPVPGPVQPLLPQSQRLKVGRAARLSAQAGHFVLLLSQGATSWHCQHSATWLGPTCCYHALRARAMCSALCIPQRQPSPTSAFIGMARDPCLAARGLPAQLVRVMRASTTLPMCSRRLRSAAAREISISVICRETAPALYGIRRAPRAGQGERGTPTRGHWTSLRAGVHQPPSWVQFHTQDLGHVTACLGSPPYSQSALNPPS